MTNEALREKVARAIYERTGGTKWDILQEEGTKEDYRIEAAAAIDVVLEEAARVAKNFPAQRHGHLATTPHAAAQQVADEIDAAIRALIKP